MYAFTKFEPTRQSDGGGWSFDWLKSPRKTPAPVIETALLTIRDAGQCRRLPVLALPPPPVLASQPSRVAKRRGKYGPNGRLHWVLEIGGELVRTKGGSVRRFGTKADALAFA